MRVKPMEYLISFYDWDLDSSPFFDVDPVFLSSLHMNYTQNKNGPCRVDITH